MAEKASAVLTATSTGRCRKRISIGAVITPAPTPVRAITTVITKPMTRSMVNAGVSRSRRSLSPDFRPHAAKARPLGDEGPYKLADADSILPRYRIAVTEFPAPASLPQEVTSRFLWL